MTDRIDAMLAAFKEAEEAELAEESAYTSIFDDSPPDDTPASDSPAPDPAATSDDAFTDADFATDDPDPDLADSDLEDPAAPAGDDAEGTEDDPEAAADNAPPPVPGAVEDGVSGGLGAKPPAATDETPTPAVPDTIRVGQYEFPRTPENEAVLEQILATVMANAANPAPAAPPAPVAPPPPPPAPEPLLKPLDPDAFADPDLIAAMNDRDAALNQHLEELRAAESRRQLAAQQDFDREVQAAAVSALNSIGEKYGLTEQERFDLDARAAAGGFVQPFQNAPDLTLQQKIEGALENAYWSVPANRDRALAQQRDAAATEISTEADARRSDLAAKRRANASSVSGGSGQVPRKPARPRTEQEKHEAMVAIVAAAEDEA